MQYKTIKLDQEAINKLEKQLQGEKRPTPPYAYYSYKFQDWIITAYQSGKVVFQGNNLEELLSLLNLDDDNKIVLPQAGSDEVGTGDYFGGVIVCAAIVDQNSYEHIKHLGVNDSKQIKDSDIIKIAPILMKHLTYSLLIVDNEKYNQVILNHNMVDIKCLLHNQAYVNLRRKVSKLPDLCVVDQFVAEKSYYHYLQNELEVAQGLHFETKAESKYLAVACASIIARYAFLKQLEEMEKSYQFSFQKGAGTNVDSCIRQFVSKFGKEELHKVAKLHFKNTQKAFL